jgi:phenylalanyl-tRNA synthetase beta chain
MRTTLWTGLIATLTYNLHRQQTRARLFEVGLCFINNEQTKKLAGLSYGTVESENWKNSKEVSHFYDIKNDVVTLLAENHLENKYEFLPSTHSALHPTQSARIVHKHTQQVVGEIGVLHPRLVQALELPMAPVLFEIDVNLLKSATTRQSFAPLSKFPEVRRDLSFLLPATISYQAIKEAIQQLGKESIQRVFVFDVYQGKGVPDGQRSIAIALILQAFSKTLTDEEVANLIQKVIDLMREQFGATLRD